MTMIGDGHVSNPSRRSHTYLCRTCSPSFRHHIIIMPRKKFRLTMPKRRTHGRPYSSVLDEGVPTDDEWKVMESYQTFVVADDEGGDHTFHRGEVALLLPSYIDPEGADDMDETKFWVAKIRDIRSRADHDVWVRVQWYYSADDVAAVIESFKTNLCGKYERIFSDHHDLVHVDSFSGVASMTRLKGDDLAQKYISRQEFYCRYNLEFLARQLHPKQADVACPICSVPYSPDDPDADQLMHFCPRPSCRIFYHRGCLEPQGGNHTSHCLQRIMNWPDTDETISIADLSSSMNTPLKRRRNQRTRNGGHLTPDEASEMTMEFLGTLPEHLVRVAEQPILCGAAFVPGGVSGNMASVVLARRFIYEALQGSTVPDDWNTSINVTRSTVHLRIGLKKTAHLCPKCNSLI